jgi:hypothetical protein
VLLAAVALPLVMAAVQARRELAPEGIGVDDAHITLRYGRNLADGHGWVWNPGGERVEGSTSTLWTLVAAGAYLLADDPEDLLFGFALALVALALALWLDRGLAAGEAGPVPRAAAATALAGLALGLDLAARPSFAVWTAASLMDGGVWCAATVAAAATLASLARPGAGRQERAAAAAAQVVLALARPEALLLGPLLVAGAALGTRAPGRRWIVPLGAAAAVQAGLLLWRLTTFGWPLPNTYYAKVDADLGARLEGGAAFLGEAVAEDRSLLPTWTVAAGVLLALAFQRLPRAKAAIPAGAAPVLALAATATLAAPVVVLLEGGDHFPGHRTLTLLRPFPAVLLLLLAATALARRTRPATSTMLAAGLVTAAAAGVYWAGGARWGRLVETTRFEVEWNAARGGIATARILNGLFGAAHPAPTVGVLAAGALPHHYRGPSRDLLGLNDVAIAHATRRRRGFYGHAAFSAEPFFDAPPEILTLSTSVCLGLPVERTVRRFALRAALANLDDDPRFHERYRLVDFLSPAGSPELCAYGRTDWLASGASAVAWRPALEPPPVVAPAPAGGAGRTR